MHLAGRYGIGQCSSRVTASAHSNGKRAHQLGVRKEEVSGFDERGESVK